jgi:hypothetical protein
MHDSAGGSNPEYRMADDVRLAVEPLVEFIIGLANAFLAAVALIGVLWSVGGALTIGSVYVPGHMVISAAIYAGLTSLAMVLLGRPLIRAVETKNASGQNCVTSSRGFVIVPKTLLSSGVTAMNKHSSVRRLVNLLGVESRSSCINLA